MVIFTHSFIRYFTLTLFSLLLLSACGNEKRRISNRHAQIAPAWADSPESDSSEDSLPAEDTATPSDNETPGSEDTTEPTSPDDSPSEYPTSCDVVLDTCANPIIVPIDTRFTVYFPAVVNGLDATEFNANGQSPQVGVGAVVIAATDSEPRAQISMQAYNLGPCTLNVTIWYGDNREEEREWSLPCEVIDLE